MRLLIKQKVFSIGDKYNIFNESEQIVYTVQSEIFTFGAKIHLCDAYGNELYFIEQRIFSFMPKYFIYKGNTQCAAINKKISFFIPKLEVISQYGSFTVDGNFMGMDFSISQNGVLLGSISKQWLTWGDTYVLDVAPQQDAAFFCALTIAIDNCLHNENNH